nr:flagellin [Bacillus dakarensis]
MIINHNISALNNYRQMGINNNANAKSMEKLSSGLRINKAGDDAAGLAISEKMRAQVRGLDQASRNSQDAISLIQTTEGALQESHNILQRMRELATQAANDTNVAVDRNEIQKEMNQLTSEINRIGNTTEFNTKKLLNGDLSDSKTVVKADNGANAVNFAIGTQWNGLSGDEQPTIKGGTSGTANKIDISGSVGSFDWAKMDAAEANTVKVTRDGDSFTVDIAAVDSDGDTLAVNADKMAYDEGTDTYSYKANGLDFKISGAELGKWTDGADISINLSAYDTDGTKSEFDITGATVATKSDFTSNTLKAAGGTHGSFGAGITVDNTDDGYIEGLTKVKVEGSGLDAAGGSYTVTLMDKDDNVLATETVTNDTAATTSIAYDQHGISFTFTANDTASFEITKDLKYTETKESDASSLNFQIGANQNQSLNLSVSDMRSEALGISSSSANELTFVNRDGQEETVKLTSGKDVTDGTNAKGSEKALDISTHENASKAITVINNAIEKVSGERSKLGATQNRLEHTISNLNNASENLTAAESRIRDVDMAKEVMEMTRANILAQASQSMLAQANQKPQSVLQLLG